MIRIIPSYLEREKKCLLKVYKAIQDKQPWLPRQALAEYRRKRPYIGRTSLEAISTQASRCAVAVDTKPRFRLPAGVANLPKLEQVYSITRMFQSN